MTDCGCRQTATTREERKTLIIALILNLIMFVIGFIAGIIAQSTALIADSFDMLADSATYFLGIIAVGRSAKSKKTVAFISGSLLLILGLSLLLEVGRRAWFGSSPESSLMIWVACLSLIINTIVLRLLRNFRNGEVHLHAAWIFTRADVVANIGVIISGILVLLTKSRYPDLIVGFAIGLYVIKESFEILKSSIKA